MENPKLSKVIGRLKKESARLIGLMDETLQISRLNSVGFVPDIEEFDLLELIQDQIDLFKDTETYRSREISLKTRLTTVVPMTDRHLFQHAFHNILSNALKYSSEEVVVKLTRPKGIQFELSVIDRGIGIPKDELANLKTEFFRASNTREYAGTGLGLYLVKTILDRLSGSISIQSVEGEGTKVTIRLKS